MKLELVDMPCPAKHRSYRHPEHLEVLQKLELDGQGVIGFETRKEINSARNIARKLFPNDCIKTVFVTKNNINKFGIWRVSRKDAE